MSLEDIINVRTEISVANISEQGFSTPLIFVHHNHFPDLVREYPVNGFRTAMLTDGFTSDEDAITAAAVIAKQTNIGPTFKIGKRSVAETQKVQSIPTVANTAKYALTLEGPDGLTHDAVFTSDGSATLAEICTGLAAAINTATGLTKAVGSGGTYVEFTADADKMWSFDALSANLFFIDVTTSPGTLDDDLAAIEAADADWYGLVLPSSAPAAIEECADWVEENGAGSHRKIFVAQTHDMKLFDSVTYNANIFKSIKDQSYVRTHVTYNTRARSIYGGAWCASAISYTPGTYDWMFKTVVGAVPDVLSESNESKLEALNGTYYQTVYPGKVITGPAQGGTGIFLDLVQLSDWSRARAIENILIGLTSKPKVKHTDEGAGAMIWGAYKRVIDTGVQNDAIDGDPATWSITVPKRSQLSPTDRSQYRWPGTKFSFTPTGALHEVGPVTITLDVA